MSGARRKSGKAQFDPAREKAEAAAQKLMQQAVTGLIEQFITEFCERAEGGQPYHDRESVFPRLCGRFRVNDAVYERWSKLPTLKSA